MSKNIPTQSIPILKNFENWLRQTKGISSASNYCTWLKYLPDHIGLKTTNPYYRYLWHIGTCVSNGQLIVAKTICRNMMDSLENHIKNNALTSQLSNDQSAIHCYWEFLSYGISSLNNQIICNGQFSTDEEISKVMFSKSSCECINSMEALISELGEDKFIKMIVENCLFFDKGIVDDRFKYILNCHINPTVLPARWSTSNCYTQKTFSPNRSFMKQYQKKGYNHDVIINGGPKGQRKVHENYDVTQIIRNVTGYTLTGKTAILKNYIISHIWGCASDPRCFTNFWNVVLVPAWADFLLPKGDGSIPIPKTIESKLTSTIMAICDKYYHMDKYSWTNLSMSQPSIINGFDTRSGTYHIKLIRRKGGKQKFGSIVSAKVTL